MADKDTMPEAHFRSQDKLEYHYWWHQNRLTMSSRWLEGRIGQGPVMMDLGSGTGGFLDQLSKHFKASRAVGVEVSPLGLEMCSEKNLDVLTGDLMKPLEVEPNSIDLVTIMDVMEHLPDDAPVLQSSFAMLKPGGYFMASIPANAWMFSTWDEQLGHFRRYSRKQVIKVVTAAGFQVEKCMYGFSYLYVPAALRRKHGNVYDDDNCIFPPVSPFVNRLLCIAGRFESWISKWIPMPFGLSVFVLARKPVSTTS